MVSHVSVEMPKLEYLSHCWCNSKGPSKLSIWNWWFWIGMVVYPSIRLYPWSGARWVYTRLPSSMQTSLLSSASRWIFRNTKLYCWYFFRWRLDRKSTLYKTGRFSYPRGECQVWQTYGQLGYMARRDERGRVHRCSLQDCESAFKSMGQGSKAKGDWQIFPSSPSP